MGVMYRPGGEICRISHITFPEFVYSSMYSASFPCDRLVWMWNLFALISLKLIILRMASGAYMADEIRITVPHGKRILARPLHAPLFVCLSYDGCHRPCRWGDVREVIPTLEDRVGCPTIYNAAIEIVSL